MNDALEKQFEGCAERQPDGTLKAYWDSMGKCWTIGWGTTGPDIVEGLIWTQAQADAALDLKIAEARKSLYAIHGNVTLTQGQEDALVDFIYEEGAQAYRTSMLRRCVDHGNWASVRTELERWIYAGGKPVRGILNRRRAEEALI